MDGLYWKTLLKFMIWGVFPLFLVQHPYMHDLHPFTRFVGDESVGLLGSKNAAGQGHPAKFQI